MTLRSTRVDLPALRQRPPRSRRFRVAAGVAVLVVLAGAAFLGVHLTSGGGASGPVAVTIPAAPASAAADQARTTPLAGASHAGALELKASGAQLTAWNKTSSFCAEDSWDVANGTVATDAAGDAQLTVSGADGSCVGLVSPAMYASVVVEADVYFPPLPGKPGTIADWTSVWLNNQDDWPADGELDAVEAEPRTGVNAVAYHWGSTGAEQSVSTDGYANAGSLPKQGPNLTPGWHVVDIASTKGSFSVWYDGKLFTSGSDTAITGAPASLLITTSVAPDNSSVRSTIGGSPVNSDSQPAALAVKYVKVWSYR